MHFLKKALRVSKERKMETRVESDGINTLHA